MIWQDMSEIQKQEIFNQYETIRKSIRSLSSKKSNYEKKCKYTEEQNNEYRIQIENLQSRYNEIEIYYRCDFCNNTIKLSFDKIKTLLKGNNKPIFCNLTCSGKYYAKKSYEGKTEEDIQARNKKISNTLKNKESNLTQEQKQTKIEKLNSYWKNLSYEQRSIRNKNNAIKTKQTKLLRYGDENYNNINKIKETYHKKYTAFNPAKNFAHIPQESLIIIRDRQLLINFIKTNIPKDNRCIHTIAEALKISESYCNTLIIRYDIYSEPDICIHRNISKPQLELQAFISDLYKGEVITNTRRIISPLELDIYIPEKNVAIEFNGNYYHTTNMVDKEYHYNKSKLCEEKGIRLIHIFEYEWNNERQRPILENIIKGALGINKTIYARKLNIEVKKSNELKDFFNANNIQGFRGGKFAICLTDIETKEVYMSYIFGDAFFGKGKYQYEVIRGATKLGYNIVGGASRIWKYFINNYNPDSCVYYVDYNYFNGSSLEHLSNMKFVKTQSSFKNYFINENKVKNRDPMHHKEIKKLEEEGLVVPIYNAGTKVYVYEK